MHALVSKKIPNTRYFFSYSSSACHAKALCLSKRSFVIFHEITLKEAIFEYGLEFLRGRPIYECADCAPLFISDSDLNAAFCLWVDEPEHAHLQRRFYGAEVRNAPLVRWIYADAKVRLVTGKRAVSA